MVIAALITFAILLIAWMVAPAHSPAEPAVIEQPIARQPDAMPEAA